MPRTARQFGLSLIALAAVCAAMAFGPAPASACEAMRAATGVECGVACGCCQAAPAVESDPAPAIEAPRPIEIRPAASAQPRTCEAAPVEDCCCRSVPTPAPSADHRRSVEPPRPRPLAVAVALPIVASPAPASFVVSRPSRVGPPPDTRLYLRNARFLI